MRRFLSILTREEGSLMILFALTMTVVFGLATIVVDTGLAMNARNRLQAAADAAALAGASQLPNKTAAATEAANYLAMNGFLGQTHTVNWPSAYDTRISVTVSVDSATTFGRVLGINQTRVTASALASGLPKLAEYALFSAHDTTALTIRADDSTINGGVHTNAALRVTGSRNKFYGPVHFADPSPEPTGTANLFAQGRRQTSYVPMPRFDAQIMAIAGGAQVINGDLILTSSSSPFTVNGALYVTGRVSIDGDKIKGKGYILSEGPIDIRGNNAELFAGASICFYSKNGDIRLRGDNGKFSGVLYAPKGKVALSGTGLQIFGGVYADTLDYTGGITINYNEQIVETLLGNVGTVRLVR